MDEKIIITVNTDGTTQIEVEGFEGSSCDGATAPYEDALGSVVEREKNLSITRLDGTRSGDHTSDEDRSITDGHNNLWKFVR